MTGECRVCGCTDNNPCMTEFGETCAWAEPDLCDFCADMIATGEDGPLVIPATEYEAQRFIEERRRAMGSG